MDTYENNDQFFHQPEPLEPQPAFRPAQDLETETPPAAPVYFQPAADLPEAATPAAPVKKKKGGFFRGFVAAVLVIALVAGSCVGTAWLLTEHFDRKLSDTAADYQQQLDDLEDKLDKQSSGATSPIVTPGTTVVLPEGATPAQVYAANQASVVLIKSEIEGSRYSSGGTSTGSGFILSSDGYVVTNYHVVEGGTSLSVVTSGNEEYEAKLVGYDNANDVALLKVEAENLPAVVLGNSDDLTVGDQVVAIGNPLGELTSTLTVGYVSAKERDVNTSGFAINMLQTDAAINSGNSGGPLFNMAGQVVGITTAKYSGSSSSGATIEGIGFAIPINDVRPLLEDLMTYGYSKSPYLGVSVSDMDPEGAAYYGMPMGAYVNEVVEGFCADKAGMKAKDIITQIGDHTVESVNDLSRALRNFEPGDTVMVVVYRAGAETKLSITLDEKPIEQTEIEELPENPESSGNGWTEGFLPGIG